MERGKENESDSSDQNRIKRQSLKIRKETVQKRENIIHVRFGLKEDTNKTPKK